MHADQETILSTLKSSLIHSPWNHSLPQSSSFGNHYLTFSSIDLFTLFLTSYSIYSFILASFTQYHFVRLYFLHVINSSVLLVYTVLLSEYKTLLYIRLLIGI